MCIHDAKHAKNAVETTTGERPDLMRQPRIAIILDENTSTGGTRYEAAKGYFRGVSNAGGLPFGIPYLSEVVSVVLNEFDGLVAVGGRFAYPDSWYISAETSRAPPSERLDIERAIVEGYLERDKPVLGICAGMQMLACLNGCRLTPDLRASFPSVVEHDKRDYLHAVEIRPDSRLAEIIRKPRIDVNSFHREAIAQLSPTVVASAHAEDGLIEAIEVVSNSFAIGLQWHQEQFVDTDHPGNAVFRALVEAAC
ncbi:MULTISPECIES: gamma-glutamyl-gamma-aminobutyrate hydrolase family protein [unclassified Rhizobium]